MAPERTGHSSFANSSRKESLSPRKTSAIYENFIEIKIEDELQLQEQDLVTEEEGEVVVYSECEPQVVKSSEDHDLTSLSWLQSNNLLKSKPLHLQEQRKKAVLEESPTSDLTEETESECSTSQSPSSRTSPQPVHMDAQDIALNLEARTTEKYTGRHYGGKEKHHYSVPYDPHLHVNSKPPYSFSCLIFMAIEDSHARALPVKEIYSWITDHFPYFNKAPTGWKNSVRHNLSLNKCFRKVDKAPNLGKGSLWIVDPQYRPNLLNALSKAPYHPCASLDRSPKAPILPPATLTPQQQDFIQIKTQNRLPNPELFPYLSKRLAASEADRMNDAEESDEDSLDDVDAATAMLELKHGQREQGKHWRKRSKVAHGEMKLLISTSPSEDHTYTVDRVKTYKQKQPMSPDEAYVGGSDSNDDNSEFLDENEESWSSDGAEQRNVASALLHLAGGSRKRTSPSREALKSARGRRNARQQPILQRTLKKASFRANAARREEALNNNSAAGGGVGGDKYNYPKPKMTDYLIYGRGSR